MYELVNNGVYRAGFATRQAAYEAAERDVHAGLARCERVLSSSRFLCGDTVSEADVRLLPTAVRFDGVYASFFRCGRKLIRSDYDHTRRWMHEMLGLVASASQGSAPADRRTLFDLALARCRRLTAGTAAHYLFSPRLPAPAPLVSPL